MNTYERVRRYLDQTRRADVTDRQLRRARKKANHEGAHVNPRWDDPGRGYDVRDRVDDPSAGG